RVAVSNGRSARQRVDVVNVLEPFEAILEGMLPVNVLQVRVDFIAIAFLGRVKTKARASQETSLQRTATAVDKIDEAGGVRYAGCRCVRREIHTSLYRSQHRAIA